MKDENPNLATCLHNHSLPVELLAGTWDARFKEFLLLRAGKMLGLLEKHVITRQDDIIKEFYQEPQAKRGERIPIVARYYSKELRGDFDLADEKIYIDGEVYSVSGGGSEAKRRLTGKEGMATNGWQFWRYTDESGEERFIEDLRSTAEDDQ